MVTSTDIANRLCSMININSQRRDVRNRPIEVSFLENIALENIALENIACGSNLIMILIDGGDIDRKLARKGLPDK